MACRLFWVLVCGVFCLKLHAQSHSLTIVDILDLKPLEKVSVQFFFQKKLITEQYSTITGKVPFPDTDKSPIDSLFISYEGYLDKSLTYSQLEALHFRVFLENIEYQLGEVILSASRQRESKSESPYQIQIIKRSDIELANPANSADLLGQQGGIFIQKSQMGGGSPNLRGFEANKVLLVIDGIRMNNAIYRSGHLQNVITIDPEMVERTEVIFGPGSVIYGSDALGGVMHFYTRKPKLSLSGEPEWNTRSALRYQSALRGKNAHIDVNYGTYKWAWLGSLSFNDFGDLQTGTNRPVAYADWAKRRNYVERINGQDSIMVNEDPNRLVGSGYRQVDISQKLFFIPNAQQSHLVNVQYSTSSLVPRYDRLTLMQDGMPRFAEWNYGPQKRLLAAYHFQLSRTQNPLFDHIDLTTAYQNIEESRISRDFQSEIRNHRIEQLHIGTVNLDLQKKAGEKHRFSYGGEALINLVASDAYQMHIESAEKSPLDTRYPDGGTEYNSQAFYLTHHYRANSGFHVNSGLRLTHVILKSQFEDTTFFRQDTRSLRHQNLAVSGNLGLVFQNQSGGRMSVMAATGFRAPNLDDVAKVFDSQPGNVVIPNPDLKPEYTYNLELSLEKQVAKRFGAVLTFFVSSYQNAIVVRNYQLAGQDSIWYDGVWSNVQANVNARSAIIAGISTSAYWQKGPFRLAHNLNYTYGQELEQNVPMDHIAPLFGKASLGFQKPRHQTELYVQYQGWKRPDRYSPRDENNAEFATEDGWPAWWTLNVKSNWQLTDYLGIQAGVENILDFHYRPFSSRISAPGRNVILALRGSW